MVMTHDRDTVVLPAIETHTPAWLQPLKGRLAAGVALAACAAACAMPLVLAGGVSAGVGALFTDSDLLSVVLFAATAAVAFGWWRTKAAATRAASAQRSTRAGVTGDGCGGAGC